MMCQERLCVLLGQVPPCHVHSKCHGIAAQLELVVGWSNMFKTDLYLRGSVLLHISKCLFVWWMRISELKNKHNAIPSPLPCLYWHQLTKNTAWIWLRFAAKPLSAPLPSIHHLGSRWQMHHNLMFKCKDFSHFEAWCRMLSRPWCVWGEIWSLTALPKWAKELQSLNTHFSFSSPAEQNHTGSPC